MDTTAIENFDTLTADELREYLKGLTIPEDNSEAYNKLKAAFNKTSSELATANKALKAKQTDEERAQAEREEHDREIQEKYEAVLKEYTIAKYGTKLAALGMDEKLSASTAESLFGGDMDNVFANLATLITNNEKAIRADIAKNAPKIDGNSKGGTYKTKAEIMAIKDPTERQNAISENMALFTGNTKN